MTAQNLGIAIVLAIKLNHASRFVRVEGTLFLAIGLAFIVLSIYLADTDGTFATLPAENLRPKLLNAQAVTALVAIVFLRLQTRRPSRCRRLKCHTAETARTDDIGL